MREEGIKIFLYSLGVPEKDITVERGYVNTYCVLAPWLHEKGRDTRPSFGIRINNDGLSCYTCFGCTPDARTLPWLLHNIWQMSGKYPKRSAQIYLDHEIFEEEESDDFPYYEDRWEREEKEEELVIIPPSVLRHFPELQHKNTRPAQACKKYFTDRKIARHVVYYAGVRFDPKRFAVVYPMTLPSGQIYLLRERLTMAKEMWTVSEKQCETDIKFSKLRVSGALFGAHLVEWEKPVMVVEGGEDVLRLYTLGYFNVVGFLTTSFTKAQLDILCRAPLVINGLDADKPGDRAFARFLQEVRGRVPVMRIHWSRAGIGIKGKVCKDSGDLVSREQLASVLSDPEIYT